MQYPAQEVKSRSESSDGRPLAVQHFAGGEPFYREYPIIGGLLKDRYNESERVLLERIALISSGSCHGRDALTTVAILAHSVDKIFWPALVSVAEAVGDLLVPMIRAKNHEIIGLVAGAEGIFKRIAPHIAREDVRAHLEQLNPSVLHAEPQKIIAYYERYRNSACGVVSMPQHFEEAHRATLTQIAVASRYKHDALMIPPQWLERHSSLLLELADRARTGIGTVYRHLTAEPATISAEQVLSLVRTFGPAAAPLLNRYGQKIFTTESWAIPDYKLLRDMARDNDCEGILTNLFRELNPQMLRDHREFVLDLFRAVQEDLPQCLNLLAVPDKAQLVERAQPLLQLAHYTRTLTSDALMYLREEEFLSHPEPFVEAAQLLGAHVIQLFKEVPSGVMTRRWSELRLMIKRHGSATAGIFARFGRSAFDVFEREDARIEEVTARAPDTAGRIFSGVPMLQWREHVERFGEGAEGMYRLSAEGGSVPVATYEQLKSQLNILHPYRYLGRRGDLWLLEENLRNLNPEYKPDRSIIFYGIARHDWNDAFRGSVVQNLCEVAQRSRLIFAECETYDDFLVYAIRAATLFGFDEQHRLVRPLHGCFVAAHSDPTVSQLGGAWPTIESLYRADDYFPVNTEISPAHSDFFAELACYIEPSGYFGIMGCSSGSRRGGDDSLVDYAKREMEHIHVVGPEATISSSSDESSHRVVIGDDGRIADIQLREQHVKLLHLRAQET